MTHGINGNKTKVKNYGKLNQWLAAARMTIELQALFLYFTLSGNSE